MGEDAVRVTGMWGPFKDFTAWLGDGGDARGGGEEGVEGVRPRLRGAGRPHVVHARYVRPVRGGGRLRPARLVGATMRKIPTGVRGNG